MTEERVQSKNLFNFRPQGFIDPEVVFYDEKMKKDFGLDPQAMEEEMKNQTEAEFVGGMREFMDGFLGNTPFATGPAYVEVTTLEHFIEICGPRVKMNLGQFAGVRFLRQHSVGGANQA